jgi:hypothetical protein
VLISRPWKTLARWRTVNCRSGQEEVEMAVCEHPNNSCWHVTSLATSASSHLVVEVDGRLPERAADALVQRERRLQDLVAQLLDVLPEL